jgi:transposase InsO family protein
MKPTSAQATKACLRAYGIVASMNGVGNCYDNAPMESFIRATRERA